MQNNIYDGQFRGNISVVGKTGCKKTSFVQKLGLDNFFGKTVKIKWVSSISLSKAIEREIQACFNVEVEFHYVQDTENLKELIQTFKPRTEDLLENDGINNSMFGENKIMDPLIVMDNVLGIAASCKEFADFLPITRKYCYHCIYVFHIIIPDTDIWKKLISQTNFLNIFQPVFPSIQFLKYLKVIVYQQPQNMFLLVRCG